LLAQLWRWLRKSLRRLQRKLKRALATPQAGRILTALLARRLPGPLRVLVEGLGDPDQRGFLFWWLAVTLIVTLAIALLLSIVLAPVTGIVALGGVGVWMLIQKGRRPAAQPS
jgi:small-conductance mechanosensitive channel